MSDDKPKGAEALNEIGARLGDLFGAVRSAIDDIGKAAEKAGERAQEGSQSFTVDTPAGPATATAGWSVRVGGLAGGASASADDFSSDPINKARKPASDQPPLRDPRTEIFDEDDAFVLTAELPGVDEAALSVAIEGGVLSFETSGARRYAHKVEIAPALLAKLDVAAREVRLVNGILEIRIPKQR